MPLFKITNNQINNVKLTSFKNEKILQKLIENNLIEVFNCTFLASEFSTGKQHSGRIDTLALSEENNPVIIEYKNVESSQLINQNLYYLNWLTDHKGDFEKVANSKLKNVNVDWSYIRVICIAPSYAKFDIYAAQVMDANLELWQYKLYQNDHLFIEEVLAKSIGVSTEKHIAGKNPVMIAAGKKAALTRLSGSYTFEEHVKKGNKNIQEIVYDIKDFIMSIDNAVIEPPKKFYLSYKISQNFVCMEIKKNKIVLFLKIKDGLKNYNTATTRDVTNIGHYGTGNYEYTITKKEQYAEAKYLIQISYNNIGG